MTVALVSTVRDDPSVVEAFVRHHLEIGIACVYLFLDRGCSVPEGLAGDARVRLLEHDPNRWRLTRLKLAQFASSEVMARQTLNAEVALSLAQDDGHDWLLHLDCDELFRPLSPLGEMFDGLSATAAEVVSFHNLEAVPETEECADIFKALTLFKRGPGLQPDGCFSPQQLAELASLERYRQQFFSSYVNGKSAARVGRGLVPDLVHTFRHFERSVRRLVGPGLVLHYPIATFPRFVEKYQTLGVFRDRWFGTIEIRDNVGPFHLMARDMVATGDRTLLRDLYRKYVLLDDAEVVSRLIDAGLLCRIGDGSLEAARAAAHC